MNPTIPWLSTPWVDTALSVSGVRSARVHPPNIPQMRFVSPMRLLRIPEPFDHADWVFEPEMDGFRALAHIRGHPFDGRSAVEKTSPVRL
jgi:ATP-dependent DNA ligase